MALTLTPWGGSKAALTWSDDSAAFKAASVMCSSTACPVTPQIPVTMKVPVKSATADPAIKASLSQPVIMITNCLLHCCACCRFWGYNCTHCHAIFILLLWRFLCNFLDMWQLASATYIVADGNLNLQETCATSTLLSILIRILFSNSVF
jgi:hypothetical protein